ncbi:hypothetical protein JRQ81_014487 [Phrynocephalus forsythii]|uniref:Tumor necrosis factor receptor superfamily member 5 n=1 Tax=Phrynocephalus forsythii TaxID=171643 RepID=A0A9Q0Y032_9SAUR|nr:hypothetical protein JRQ81_014487 [Phrynocephalus forsythii]
MTGWRAPGWGAAAWWGGWAWALLTCLALEQGPNCKPRQYLEEEQCCSKCPPGQKVAAVCAGEADTVCVPCESQHFQAGWTKEKHCTPYKYCDQNAGLLLHAPGTATQDAECRCQKGTHCSSPECLTCRPNKACGLGEGVQQEASHLEDTVCAGCPEGFFSNVSSATAPCQPWSSCADRNLVQKAKGTRESDVICDLPSPPPPPPLPPPPPPPPAKEPGRTHLLALVLLPLGALLTMGGAFVIRHWQCKGAQKEPQDQGPLPHERRMMKQPEETDEQGLAFPTQETLLGGQPLTLEEDSKEETRLAAQELV